MKDVNKVPCLGFPAGALKMLKPRVVEREDGTFDITYKFTVLPHDEWVWPGLCPDCGARQGRFHMAHCPGPKAPINA